LQISEGGLQDSGAGIRQSMLQMPEPVDPQIVVQPTSRPMRQSNPSSVSPLQLSSMPLHISVSEVGTQFDSHDPSPSLSVQPSSQIMSHTPISQTGSA